MKFLQTCCRRNKSSDEKPRGARLSLRQKFCYGGGHILNDLAANAWFSYLIIFLTKVARLSNTHTGLVVMLGQVTDGVCTPITAILNDRTVCRYGRRKIWHLLGSICVTLSFPLLFVRLLDDGTSNSSKLAYYIGIAAVFQFGWGCVQISHLSLIPEIAVSESEKVELNAIRSALRFVCGIFVFGVTWILLGRSSEESISPGMWKQFMYLALIIIGTGMVFNIVFHVGIKEPPSDALLHWLDERKNGKRKQRKHNGPERKALLKAVYQQPSPSRRSGASPLVVLTLCEKQNKKSACKAVGSNSKKNLDDGNAENASEEIVDKSALLNRRDKTKMQWLKSAGIYKMGVLYICTRLYVNVSQSYLPLYLTETMKFEKEAIAYFPLVVLVTGVLASTFVKPLNKRLGSKITFCLGSMMAVSASFWFYVQSVDGRKAVYGTVMLMGSGGSVMLVTSLSLIAHLIGQNKRSGAFVYGFIGFFDKVFSGAIFAVIQHLNPGTGQSAECVTCDEYVRHVQSLVPGVAAVLGLLFVMVFFDSIFVCKRRAHLKDVAVQVNLNDDHEDSDEGSSGVGTGTFTEKTNDAHLGSLESGLSRERNNDSLESRNFTTPSSSARSYVAMRLASSVIPSPILERRTIL